MTLAEWTKLKAEFLRMRSPGIFQGILIADILIESEWGTHPVAQEELILTIKGKEKKKYSNNLTLMGPGPLKSKTNLYEGKEYQAFKGWKDFAVAYTDHLTFSRGYDDVLKCFDFMGQVEQFSLTKESPEDYNMIILETLTRLHHWQQRKLSLRSSLSPSLLQ